MKKILIRLIVYPILLLASLYFCISNTGALSDSPDLWPEGKIPVVITDFPPEQKMDIYMAMTEWEMETGIIFYPATKEDKDYVVFTSEQSWGCQSYVGRAGGVQELNLSRGCNYGIILHELGHVIGLIHEHQRPDRDKYVTILWKNVKLMTFYNFIKSNGDSKQFDLPYDYESIMHYDSYAFSSNFEPTMLTKDKKLIEDPFVLSPWDIAKVKWMYTKEFIKRDFK